MNLAGKIVGGLLKAFFKSKKKQKASIKKVRRTVEYQDSEVKVEPVLTHEDASELANEAYVNPGTVMAQKAEKFGLTVFEYFGPIDQVTRPLCGKILSRIPAIYTLEEISEMDNGEGLSVLEYGGGKGCRHHWSAITEDYARELGWKDKN